MLPDPGLNSSRPVQVGSGRARLELGRESEGLEKLPPCRLGFLRGVLRPVLFRFQAFQLFGGALLPGLRALEPRLQLFAPDHRCLRLFALSDELLAPRFNLRFRDLFRQPGRGRRFSEPGLNLIRGFTGARELHRRVL